MPSVCDEPASSESAPVPRRPGRPRGASKKERRQQILKAAAAVFAQEGYRGASFSSIARAAGISPTGLVHHFPEMEQLLIAVLSEHDLHSRKAIAGLSDMGSRAPRHRGWGYFELLVELVRRNEQQPELVRLFATISGEATEPGHPAAAWLHTHHAAFSRSLLEALEEIRQLGRLRPDAPVEQIVRLLIAAMDGLQTQWLIQEGRFSMAEAFAEQVQMLRSRWELPAPEPVGSED